jgi:hypothetical protein
MNDYDKINAFVVYLHKYDQIIKLLILTFRYLVWTNTAWLIFQNLTWSYLQDRFFLCIQQLPCLRVSAVSKFKDCVYNIIYLDSTDYFLLNFVRHVISREIKQNTIVLLKDWINIDCADAVSVFEYLHNSQPGDVLPVVRSVFETDDLRLKIITLLVHPCFFSGVVKCSLCGRCMVFPWGKLEIFITL